MTSSLFRISNTVHNFKKYDIQNTCAVVSAPSGVNSANGTFAFCAASLISLMLLPSMMPYFLSRSLTSFITSQVVRKLALRMASAV